MPSALRMISKVRCGVCCLAGHEISVTPPLSKFGFARVSELGRFAAPHCQNIFGALTPMGRRRGRWHSVCFAFFAATGTSHAGEH